LEVKRKILRQVSLYLFVVEIASTFEFNNFFDILNSVTVRNKENNLNTRDAQYFTSLVLFLDPITLYSCVFPAPNYMEDAFLTHTRAHQYFCISYPANLFY